MEKGLFHCLSPLHLAMGMIAFFPCLPYCPHPVSFAIHILWISTWKGCMLYHRLKVVFTAANQGGAFPHSSSRSPLTPSHRNYKWKIWPSLGFVPANKCDSRKAGWVCAAELWLCPQWDPFRCPCTLAPSTVTLWPVLQIVLHIKHRLAAVHVSLLLLLFLPWL